MDLCRFEVHLYMQRIEKEKLKRENAAAPAVTELSWIISYFTNASLNSLQRNNAASNSWLHCFLLQIQMTSQLSPIWGSKQEINPLLCTSVFSRVSTIAIISFFFGCLSISTFLQLFFSGEKHWIFVQILVSKRYRTELMFTWCKSKAIKYNSYWIYASRPVLLYSSHAIYCLRTLSENKAFQVGHGNTGLGSISVLSHGVSVTWSQVQSKVSTSTEAEYLTESSHLIPLSQLS